MFVVSYQRLRASINVICDLYLQLWVLAVNTLKPSEISKDPSGFFLFVWVFFFTYVSTLTRTLQQPFSKKKHFIFVYLIQICCPEGWHWFPLQRSMNTNFAELETSLRYSTWSIMVNMLFCILSLSRVTLEKEDRMIRKYCIYSKWAKTCKRSGAIDCTSCFYHCISL